MGKLLKLNYCDYIYIKDAFDAADEQIDKLKQFKENILDEYNVSKQCLYNYNAYYNKTYEDFSDRDYKYIERVNKECPY